MHSLLFNVPPTTEIYPLSLHDALPISQDRGPRDRSPVAPPDRAAAGRQRHRDPDRGGRAALAVLREEPRSVLRPARLHREGPLDRKSTRLNSSHTVISYAVFCLKKKIN